MADRNRPGDETAGEHADDVFDDDALTEGAGGTATKARRRTDRDRVGPFGRIGRFIREVVAELRKVIRPTRKELITYTTVVVIFVTIMMSIVGLLDLAYIKVVGLVFGD